MNAKKIDRVELLFPSKYVKAAHLRGRDVHAKIAKLEPRHELKRSDGSVEFKPVLHLRFNPQAEIEPTMIVLNKTNATSIAGIYGPELSDWIGKIITLYPATVSAFGEAKEAIRIRPTAPQAKTKQPDQEPAHDPNTGEVTDGQKRYASAEDVPPVSPGDDRWDHIGDPPMTPEEIAEAMGGEVAS